MDVALLRDLLRLTPAELGRALGLGEAAGRQVLQWERGQPVLGPEAVALTYLSQGAFAEKSGLPEYLVCCEGSAGGSTFVFRSWRPRFIAVTAPASVPPLPGQGWTWVRREVQRLVVLQWWDDPSGFDTVDLIHRAAARVRRNRDGLPASDHTSWLALLKASPSFAVVLSGPHHVLDFVNDSYVAMMGERDLEGLPLIDAAPDVVGQGYFEMLDSVLDTGKRVAVDYHPLRLNVAGVEEDHVISVVYEPMRDEAGNVTAIFAEGVDHTRRRRSSRQLAALQADED